MRVLTILPALLLMMAHPATADGPDLVELDKHVPGLVCDAGYFGEENFTGRPVPGYKAAKCLGARPMADALIKVQAGLKEVGLGLIVWDAYRPQQAVDAFVEWAADPSDTLRKADYYPHVTKDRLIPDGYIAARSGHSRASTVDLGLVDLKSGRLIDMGTSFDFFGPESGIAWQQLSAEARASRLLLRHIMIAAGFRPYDAEWWHFTLKDEPWPDTWFNVPVK